MYSYKCTCTFIYSWPLYLHACIAEAAMADPLVRPPPQTVDDMEDLTGDTEEINLTADGNDSAPIPHVSSADKTKVHFDHCLPHWVTLVVPLHIQVSAIMCKVIITLASSSNCKMSTPPYSSISLLCEVPLTWHVHDVMYMSVVHVHACSAAFGAPVVL